MGTTCLPLTLVVTALLGLGETRTYSHESVAGPTGSLAFSIEAIIGGTASPNNKSYLMEPFVSELSRLRISAIACPPQPKALQFPRRFHQPIAC